MLSTLGLGWDEQFAFRGHIIVLIDEKTSSDAEGEIINMFDDYVTKDFLVKNEYAQVHLFTITAFSRGISELGLGQLVGSRTWGGGIWLSSDNKLVDGGIATAPEFGTYNDNFGWGLGIEQMGVEPDVIVDNNPRQSFEGKDEQLERAIELLYETLQEHPVNLPLDPGRHIDMSLKDSCSK